MSERTIFLTFENVEPTVNDIDRGKPKNSETNLSQCHFVHHKPHSPVYALGLKKEFCEINPKQMHKSCDKMSIQVYCDCYSVSNLLRTSCTRSHVCCAISCSRPSPTC
jgi:hypothetical protein